MKQRDFIFIAVSIFLLAIFWIASQIIQGAFNSTISKALTTQIDPITQTFNTSVISSLKERDQVSIVNDTATSSSSLQQGGTQ